MPKMLKRLTLNPPVNGYRRLAIDVTDDGVYLLLSHSAGDGPYEFDHGFATVEEAETAARETFGVNASDWRTSNHS